MTAILPSAAAPDLDLPLRFAPERPCDSAQVDALVDAAFGPGRFAKTAERVRERAVQRLDLSICAWSGEMLLGAVRMWSIAIGGEPALFLGPIEVCREHRRRGLASLLVRRACAAAQADGARFVLLVGAAAIFEPIGFEVVPPGRVTLPGPVDPGRLFWRALTPEAVEEIGSAVASRAVS